MKISLFAVFFIAIVSGSVQGLHLSHAAEKPEWYRDFDHAQTVAQQSKKDLFVVLTGHGWCLICDVLDQEVFQQAEFVEATKDEFVFVELDENFGESPEEKAREKRHRQLKKTFLSKAVPTVVLADSDGRPYAITTGYDREGPTQFLSRVSGGLQTRRERDLRFESAASKSGVNRVRELHRGLQVVAPKLGSLDERQDDPLLVFYASVVNSILESTDAESAQIRKHYVERGKTRDNYVASRTVLDELRPFHAAKDYGGAVRHIEELLPSVEDPKVRWKLESSRQAYLEWGDQHEKALENARRLLASDELSDEDREYLLGRESFNLFNLNRFDEACEHYDRRIATATTDKRKLWLLGWKSQMVAAHGTPQQRIRVHREYREASKSGSNDWLTATGFLADAHGKLGQHDVELEFLNEVIARQDSPWIKLQLIDCYLALEETTKAKQVIEQLSRHVESLEVSERKSDQEQQDYLKQQLERRRKSIESSLSD